MHYDSIFGQKWGNWLNIFQLHIHVPQGLGCPRSKTSCTTWWPKLCRQSSNASEGSSKILEMSLTELGTCPTLEHDSTEPNGTKKTVRERLPIPKLNPKRHHPWSSYHISCLPMAYLCLPGGTPLPLRRSFSSAMFQQSAKDPASKAVAGEPAPFSTPWSKPNWKGIQYMSAFLKWNCAFLVTVTTHDIQIYCSYQVPAWKIFQLRRQSTGCFFNPLAPGATIQQLVCDEAGCMWPQLGNDLKQAESPGTTQQTAGSMMLMGHENLMTVTFETLKDTTYQSKICSNNYCFKQPLISLEYPI